MSLLYRNNDVALPHAGLLSYFTQPRENDGCNESAQSSPTVSPSSSDVKHSAFDEEAQDEFWELDSTTDTDCEDFCQPARRRYHGLFHMLYDFWGFLCLVALSACAVLMGLDVALGQFGMDIGLTDCMLGRHLPPPPMVHELHFCLASPNREAPGPQTWHSLSSKPHHVCTTELITLLVDSSDAWKLRSDDGIVLGNEQQLTRGPLRIGKFLGSGEVLSRGDLGDNIAEEGVLSQFGKRAL